MGMNIFKTKCYRITLTPENVIEKIKTKTLYGKRITKDDCLFKGTIWKNAFRVHLFSNANIKLKYSKNVEFYPEFFGEVQGEGLHTDLYVKMRPNGFGYFMFVLPVLVFVITLVSYILSMNNIFVYNSSLEIMLILCPVFCLLAYGGMYLYYYIKAYDMECKLKDIFKKHLINPNI